MTPPGFTKALSLAVASAAVFSLAATGAGFLSFRRAMHAGQEMGSERAAEAILAHEAAQRLERKLAKSRSFILTGDENFFQESEQARSEFLEALGELEAGARPAERAELERIAAVEKRHHARMEVLADRRRAGARPARLGSEMVEELKPMRDELDRRLDGLIARKHERLRSAEREIRADARLARNVSAAASFASFLAFVVVLWLVRRLAAAQLQVEKGLVRDLSAFDRELDSISYAVAHDLRTPLRAITSFSELALARAPAKDPQLRSFLERVRAAGLRMSELIDALLALSRITRHPLRTERVDLSALAVEVAAELASAEPSRDVRFVARPGLVAKGDPGLLRAALFHLLDNAWKFTAEVRPAVVEFGAEASSEGETYFVRDNGVGFDARYAAKLFEPFETLHAQERYPGFGIGLPAVERIVHRHGGSVWARSEPGKGAVFCFTLGRRVFREEPERRRRPAHGRR